MSAMRLRLACAFVFLQAISSFALAQPATVLDQYLGCSIYSSEQPPRFLGVISRSKAGDSIRNISGTYGSPSSVFSIRNPVSPYGSAASYLSAYSSIATGPPRIVNGSLIIIGFLTKNGAITGRVDPDFLLTGLDVLDNWNSHSGFFTTDTFQYLIRANDGTQLGFTYPDTSNSLSIINESGPYGSSTSSTSIYNPISSYGSSIGSQSAYNPIASSPPVIYRKNMVTGITTAVAYITKNTFKTPYEDPDELKVALLLAALPVPSPTPAPTPTPTPTPTIPPTPTPTPPPTHTPTPTPTPIDPPFWSNWSTTPTWSVL